MNRVFIINPGQHNYDAAKHFGQLVPIMPGRAFNPFNMDDLLRRTEQQLMQEHNATPEDFLILCGNPYLNAIAVAIFQEAFGSYQVLIYGARHGDYVPRRVVVNAKKVG
jgi:hypothetical protein